MQLVGVGRPWHLVVELFDSSYYKPLYSPSLCPLGLFGTVLPPCTDTRCVMCCRRRSSQMSEQHMQYGRSALVLLCLELPQAAVKPHIDRPCTQCQM